MIRTAKMFSAFLILSPLAALSEEIDLDVIAGELLQGKVGNPQNATADALMTVRSMTGFLSEHEDIAVHWGVENLTARASEVRISKIETSDIPLEVARDSRTLRNCTGRPQPSNETISLSYTVGSTATLSRSVTSTNNKGLSLQIPKIGLTASASSSEQIALTRSDVQTETRTATETTQVNLSVPEFTIMTVTAVKTTSRDYLDFSADVVFDADVFTYITGVNSGDGKEYKGKLSALIPSETDRTVSVEGELQNVRGRDLDVSYIETKADPGNPDHCIQRVLRSAERNAAGVGEIELPNTGRGNSALPSSSSDDTQSIGRDILDILPVQNDDQFEVLRSSVATWSSSDSKVTVPFISGMSITTSDTVANVDIRAQSMGPGFCAVTFTGPLGPIQVLAPPFSFSNWMTLYSHVGRSDATLTSEVNCDTGILAEVTYFHGN